MVVAAGSVVMTLLAATHSGPRKMALPVDPSLALGTLQTLADRQGRALDPMSEEGPGKILHEVRLGVVGGLSLGSSRNIMAASTRPRCL